MNDSCNDKCSKCPELVEWIDWTVLICKKGHKPYVPSYSELHSYCKSNNYDKCTYYKTPSVLLSNVYTGWFEKKLN